jgi:pimeloyl-ACP methyl ester carboxylesterase
MDKTAAGAHVSAMGSVKAIASAALLAATIALVPAPVLAQDYEKEQRWATDIQSTLMVGNVVWLTQKNGHTFLTLYTEPAEATGASGTTNAPRGALIIAHGRGWSPDFELYGTLRTRLAESGYTTLSIQLPVLSSTAKLGDYKPVYPDAIERFKLAADYLKSKGYTNIAIVSHSLGATMANQYLISTEDKTVKAWVFIGIINGLEEMYRIKIPVLDVFGSKDWDIARWGADERKAEIAKAQGSEQVIVPGAEHFFEGKEDVLVRVIDTFLGRVFDSRQRTGAR